MQNRKNLEAAHRIRIEFKFFDDIPAGIYGYALVLTNELLSVSSNGQRNFDLIIWITFSLSERFIFFIVNCVFFH